ncbi:MAG TPA: hypothetical protein VF772_06030, partial [Terriglobales bacterium]
GRRNSAGNLNHGSRGQQHILVHVVKLSQSWPANPCGMGLPFPGRLLRVMTSAEANEQKTLPPSKTHFHAP